MPRREEGDRWRRLQHVRLVVTVRESAALDNGAGWSVGVHNGKATRRFLRVGRLHHGLTRPAGGRGAADLLRSGGASREGAG